MSAEKVAMCMQVTTETDAGGDCVRACTRMQTLLYMIPHVVVQMCGNLRKCGPSFRHVPRVVRVTWFARPFLEHRDRWTAATSIVSIREIIHGLLFCFFFQIRLNIEWEASIGTVHRVVRTFDWCFQHSAGHVIVSETIKKHLSSLLSLIVLIE